MKFFLGISFVSNFAYTVSSTWEKVHGNGNYFTTIGGFPKPRFTDSDQLECVHCTSLAAGLRSRMFGDSL